MVKKVGLRLMTLSSSKSNDTLSSVYACVDSVLDIKACPAGTRQKLLWDRNETGWQVAERAGLRFRIFFGRCGAQQVGGFVAIEISICQLAKKGKRYENGESIAN